MCAYLVKVNELDKILNEVDDEKLNINFSETATTVVGSPTNQGQVPATLAFVGQSYRVLQTEWASCQESTPVIMNGYL